MIRYLDRDPRAGDRVEVCYEGTVEEVGASVKTPNVTVRRGDNWVAAVRVADLRVIAPEPKVGDVVTADMDNLPHGTIIEDIEFRGVLAVRDTNSWYRSGYSGSTPLADVLANTGPWRIVRIGGASDV